MIFGLLYVFLTGQVRSRSRKGQGRAGVGQCGGVGRAKKLLGHLFCLYEMLYQHAYYIV